MGDLTVAGKRSHGRAEPWRWFSRGAGLSGQGRVWRGQPALRGSRGGAGAGKAGWGGWGWGAGVTEPLSAGELARLRRASERVPRMGGVVDSRDRGAIGPAIVPAPAGAAEETTGMRPYCARSPFSL